MNKTGNYDMTILVPLYDEQDNMERLYEELKNYINKASIKTCVMFINDGSKDKSLDYIKDFCRKDEYFLFISLDSNYGLSTGLKAGIDNTFSRLVAYIDADLQTYPEDFELLIPYVNDGYDLAMGIRADRKDTLLKKFCSKCANNIRRALLNDDIKDTGCPLKIIKTETAKKMPFFKGSHRLIPSLIKIQSGKTIQIPVRHSPRIAGVAKYNFWNRLVSPMVDCLGVEWMERRYIDFEVKEEEI